MKSERWHVFKENTGGFGLPDDPLDLGPEPSVVFLAELFSGNAKRLAGKPRNDHIDATHSSAIEGCEIVPHRIAMGRLLMTRENGRGVAVPLDCDHTSRLGHEQLDPLLQATDT